LLDKLVIALRKQTCVSVRFEKEHNVAMFYSPIAGR